MIRHVLIIIGSIFCLPVSAIEAKAERDADSCVVNAQQDPVLQRMRYQCAIGQCKLLIDVDEGASEAAGQAVGVGATYGTCSAIPYDRKVTVWASLLAEARKNGQLEVVGRIGPGPGPEMCAGALRARLIAATSRLLSDEKFVRNNRNRIDKGRLYIKDLPLLWEEAGTFDEYLGMFRQLGHELALQEYEGVIFDEVNRDEILRYDPTSKLKRLKIPCNAMVYFSPKRVP